MSETSTVTAPQQVSTRVMLLLSIVAALWYAQFLLFSGSRGDLFPYLLLCLAELISLSQFIGLWSTVLLGGAYKETTRVEMFRKQLKSVHHRNIPENLVTIFIPTAGEPLEIIRATAAAARDVHVTHRTVILDDAESDAVRELASELGVEYFRRDEHNGRKAGNINAGLDYAPSEYFAIVDADYILHPEFLEETLPWLLSDNRVAFVQTPQHFRNTDGFISGGSAEAQEIFYRHVHPAKNAFGAAFCVGTNVLFRKSAVDEIGGIYDLSNSEDIWTTVLLHERGWKSVYIPIVLAEGLAPETLGDHFKQQFRWARGGFEVFFKHNALRLSLTLDQKLQYLFTTMHYFCGISIFCYALLPLLHAYFGLRPFSVDAVQSWAIHALPYFSMIVLSTIHLLGRVPLWRSIVVSVSAFPAHLSALFSVLTGISARWSVTGMIKRRTDYITSVAPHLLIGFFALGGIPKVLLSDSDIRERVWMAMWLMILVCVMFSIVKRAFPSSARHPVESFTPSYA